MLKFLINLPMRIFRKFMNLLFPTNPENAVNLMHLNDADEAVLDDAKYTLAVTKSYLNQISKFETIDILGKNILEIGPGRNFGSVAILMCLGANVSVSDRWLVPFSKKYHRKVYSRLAQLAPIEFANINLDPLLALSQADSHDGFISPYPDAESLILDDSAKFDILLSNAVFEHLIDIDKASQNLANASNIGSLHIHQIDLRQHSNFECPLEYLLMSPTQYEEWLAKDLGHSGSARRRFEYEASFRTADFEVLEVEVNGKVGSDYLKDFVPRLRAARDSKYCDLDGPDLTDIGIRYSLRKTA